MSSEVSEMKKLLAIVLILLLCLSLTGCSGNLGEIQEGAYEGEGFSLTVPSGWHRNEDQEGALVFLPDGYSKETHSYISLSTASEPRIPAIDDFKDSLKEDLAAQYEATLGENAIYTIANFEKSELNGYECYYVLSYYVKDGLAFKQEQYTLDTASGSFTVSYVLADGEDFASAFEESIKTITVK